MSEAEEAGVDTRVLSQRQLLTICVAQLNEAIQITMPYTLAVYMVRDFQAQQRRGLVDEEAVGRRTGLLAACFCAAQFVSSFPLGRISDRLGRKALLIMSNVSSCISVILFGLSGDFLTAAILRLLGGFFNCTFVCLKSMIGESCSMQAQARPLSILSLCWGIGTVVGPSLGGTLSRPCDTIGSSFMLCRPGQLLKERPFCLPCFAVGLVSFTAALCSMFFLEETLPAIAARKYQTLQDTEEAAKQLVAQIPEIELSRLLVDDPLADRLDADSDAEQQSLVGTDAEDNIQQEMERSDQVLGDDGPALIAATEKTGHGSNGRAGSANGCQTAVDNGRQLGSGDPSAGKIWNQLTKIEAEKELAVLWYKDVQTLLVISGYIGVCLCYNLLDELTPIYGSADRSNGGLGFTPTQLSLPLIAGGVSIFVWNLFFYPWYQRALGVRNSCRLALLLSIPLAMLIGLPSLLPWATSGLQGSLAAVLFFKNICATSAFTSAVLMINAIAPQKDLGSVNGASQASASLVRAIGPALGGLIWGFSVSVGTQLLGFIVTSIGFVLPLISFGVVSAPQVQAA